MLNPNVLIRLSSARQFVIIKLEETADAFGSDNLEKVYDLVNEAFFEKASDIIRPYSRVLADKMLNGV